MRVLKFAILEVVICILTSWTSARNAAGGANRPHIATFRTVAGSVREFVSLRGTAVLSTDDVIDFAAVIPLLDQAVFAQLLCSVGRTSDVVRH